MRANVWRKALKECAAPERARHFLEMLKERADAGAAQALSRASGEQARLLATLFSGSDAMSTLLVAHPDWLALLTPDFLRFPRRRQGLRGELRRWLPPLLEARDYASALRQVRQFKQRELLRIAARDLARLGTLPEIILELSNAADAVLEAIWRICFRQLTERYGRPFHQDASGQWQPATGCVLGMGKLGGQELNYSSDVDLLFVYAEEGSVFEKPPGKDQAPRPTLSNHQFFNRLAEAFIAETTRMTPEGMLYRVDLRLRPEGETGPLNRSMASYENYYAQWGQTWERMMLIKTRGVAGDEILAAEFIEMIQPFRYPRSVGQGVLREIAAVKDRIENEVLKADELDWNVKLGRGGIREIEFIVQALQMLHAGHQPFLQEPQTLPCLQKLVQYERLSPLDSRRLRKAYCFLRDAEHRLQMEHNLQTHTIPADPATRTRLARLMEFSSFEKFYRAYARHTRDVRRVFDRLLKADRSEINPALPFPRQFEGFELEWQRFLLERGFRDASKALRVIREFVEGPGYIHVSPRTSALAYELLPKLFALCPTLTGTTDTPPDSRTGSGSQDKACDKDDLGARFTSPFAENTPELDKVTDKAPKPGVLGQAPDRPRLSDPDRVVMRLDSFISAYGARSTLFELWNRNASIFELLLMLFDRSEFLAELAIRTPDLVDELVTSGRLRQRKTADETLRDLRHGITDKDQYLWIRRYHQAELMRIGLRDILGLADFEQHLSELSALAQACLQYALETMMRRHRLNSPPFAIIGLGKLGGAEIDYGSDLDILFVAPDNAEDLVRLGRMALEVIDLLSQRTEQGLVFHTDARLRPDGEKGLLVNTLKAYEEYYRRRARLWEIQSLTRARSVAGDADAGERFDAMAGSLANFSKPAPPIAAYAPDWKQEIHRMRLRIESQRTPASKADLAIKTGAGGVMDAEFIAQALCLEHGWREPDTLRALERGAAAGVLPAPQKLIANYRQLRRIEGILRRWSYEGETSLPDDPAPFYRVSVRCGFPTPQAFRAVIAQCRTAIREVYSAVFPY
jgi:[glutamine synthetase] adenylyltransferase / [glutamine synthetase]-adenylyl-L-tyrosine phosphorylase